MMNVLSDGLVFVFLAHLFTFHLAHETLCRLEAGEVVCCDDDSGVLGDVAGGLLSSVLDDEAAETSEIDVLFFKKTCLDDIHECFHGDSYILFGQPGRS